MAEPTLAELQTRRDEVEAQLAEMVGAADFSVGSMSVTESTLYETLKHQLLDLNFRINNSANPGHNCKVSVLEGGW